VLLPFVVLLLSVESEHRSCEKRPNSNINKKRVRTNSTRVCPEALDRREVQVPLWESQLKCEGSDTQEKGCASE
jgi:hypothetical protein